jgi:C4-dicarboxylate-specific signal transduction histidine kinase
METLFDAFRSTKGINESGLGLWISKGIIESIAAVRSLSRSLSENFWGLSAVKSIA